MQGSLQSLVDMFDGNDKCLVIPVYQRNYDWKHEQCGRLFDDLESVARERRANHFFGSVVYKDEGAIGESTIIDGQQRLTTVNLLFLALRTALLAGDVSGSSHLPEQIYESYLRSKFAASGYKLKLKPVKADASAYKRLFDDPEYVDHDSRVTVNYQYFLQRLRDTDVTGDDLFDAIRKLQVMRLKLEHDDNAQLIFESLNSTGLDLSEADMIRNFILMGLDRATQEALYEKYWNRIEEAVAYDTSTFIRHYLTTKLGRSPRKDSLYAEFRAFVGASGDNIETVLDDMRSNALCLRDIRASHVGDARVDRLLSRYNMVDREVTMPMLMSTVLAFRHDEISAAQLYRIVAAIDTYLARRWLCGYPTSALNKIFALLYREARKAAQPGDDFADVVIYLLLRRQGTGTFPADEEFYAALMTKDLYHINAAYRNYFWESLENGTSNDVRDIASALNNGTLSIEHVMPQTLSSAWRTELGDDAEVIHATWLHRLGNLTVTGYNASYSNASFASKRERDGGFNDSPFRVNKRIRAADRWSEASMQQRAAELADAALTYWPQPTSSFRLPQSARDVEPLGLDATFTNRLLRAWEFRGVVHQETVWKQMLIDVVTLLADEDPVTARRAPSWSAQVRSSTSDSVEGTDWHRLAAGVDVWTAISNAAKMTLLRRWFAAMDIDPDELVFHLAPSEDSNAHEGDE